MKNFLTCVFFILFFISCKNDGKQTLVPYSDGSKWGFRDAGMNITLSAQYDDVLPFAEGLAAVKANGKWGYINQDGEEVIKPQKFQKAGSFSEKMAMVFLNGKWGFINKEGKEIVPPVKYDFVNDFSDGFAVVGVKSRYGFINKKGEIVIDIKYDFAWPFENGIAKVFQNNRFGYINKSGEEIIPVKYDYIGSFYQSTALSRQNNRWFFISTNGKVVSSLYYDNVTETNMPGVYEVSKNRKYGFINNKGDEVVLLKYDDIDQYNNNLYKVEKNGQYGLIDFTGREIIPAVYDGIMEVGQLNYIVHDGDYYFIVDPLGNPEISYLDAGKLVPPEKEKTGTFSDKRDGNDYHWVSVNDKDWTIENLMYKSANSKCFEKDRKTDCDTYGRYYQWETAKNACPEGWKLPSLDDWQVLINELGGEETAYRVLTGSDSLSLNLKPGGYYYNETSFLNTGEYGYFWTSTPDGPNAAICIWLNPVEGSIMEFSSSTAHYRNVRCMRE
jgi:uncharacterized protein (TIGR02145 family)